MRTNALNALRNAQVIIESDRVRTLEEDLQVWTFAQSLIERLGAGGMSSEDSDVEDGQPIYRVKIVVWRRRMEALLQLIDRQRSLDPSLYTARGSQGVKRIRIPEGTLEENWEWKSRRMHLDGLPEVLYDPEWLQVIRKEHAVVSLCVSREEFEYFKVIAGDDF
jgi:hypothetical protein